MAALVVMNAGPGKAQSQPPTGLPKATLTCAGLTGIDFTSLPEAPTKILSARMVGVPADGLPVGPPFFQVINYPMGDSKVAAYCDVIGYVSPQNKFELKLPVKEDWNEKLFFSACAGFCGTLDGSACNFGLARGYASITVNGGHDSALGFDGLWARNAPQSQEEFAWRGNHGVTLAAKAIIARYYGKAARHAYMAGCSKGGQAVLIEAQRFPTDFDGLIPIAPVYEYTRRSNIAGAWFAQAVDDGHGGSVLNQVSVDAIHKSVLAKCGAQSGVDEGLVTDPLACDWKPRALACKRGSSTHACLTPRQVDAVTRLMTPPHDSKGQVLYRYAYVPGSETEWDPWNYVAFGLPAGSTAEPVNYQVSTQYQRYLDDAAERDGVTALTFDFDRDPATLRRAEALYDATSYDLTAFKAHGGKMLMWHGMADGGIPFTSSIGYYKGVEKVMGSRNAVQEFFRLFLVPGVHHCSGGPGPFEFDALSALDAWVENGTAPEKLIARHSNAGRVDRSRPVFPYPIAARYSGHGDPMQATSYGPVDPEQSTSGARPSRVP